MYASLPIPHRDRLPNQLSAITPPHVDWWLHHRLAWCPRGANRTHPLITTRPRHVGQRVRDRVSGSDLPLESGHLNWLLSSWASTSFGSNIHNGDHHALLWGLPRNMFSDSAIQLQPVFAQWIQDCIMPRLPRPPQRLRALVSARCSTEPLFGCGWPKVAAGPIPLGTGRTSWSNQHPTPSRFHVTVLIC